MADPELAEQRLEEWRESLNPVLERLRAFELSADFPFNYSAESLDRLETVLLERFPADAAPARDVGFVESVMGYLGEALLRAGGGRWAWDRDPASPSYDQPVIHPDEALGRAALAPLQLVINAVRSRTGAAFSDSHAALTAAVAEHRKWQPSWSPTKEHTPGVDELDVPPTQWLTHWLAEREAMFPKWVAGFGGDPVAWDFSTDGYDALETLVRQRLSSVDNFTAPEHDEFVQGAIWYLGEIARRTRTGVVWKYNPAVPGSTNRAESLANPWVGRPYVDQRPDGDAAVPLFALMDAVEDGEPGSLRARFASFR